MTTQIGYGIALLVGFGMIFLGSRFFFAPEAATENFGIHFSAGGDYSLHYTKGIRDIFSGILLSMFVLLNERRAVGITLLAGAIIPVADLWIVCSKSYNGVQQGMPHIIAILLCVVAGIMLLATKPSKKSL